MNSRREFTKALAAVPAAASIPAYAQRTNGNSNLKVLRYAFRTAETGFDPAQVNDFYSSSINGNIFDAPLAYDFLARPTKIVLNTAESIPEVSSDFTQLTVRIRPGIYFQDHPAFKGQKRELVAQDYVYSIKRFYHPKFKSQNVTLLENSKILGMTEIRVAALKGAKFDYDREVEGIRALDRFTFRIKLGEPGPRFYHALANSSFLGAVAREVDEMYDANGMMANPSAPAPIGWSTGAARRASCSRRIPTYRDDIL